MRLIACPSCHAQYDVEHVALDAFDCRCGKRLENRPLKAVDAEVHRCASCGAIARSEAPACDYCGAEVVRDPRRLHLICPECFARNEDAARFCTACGVAFSPEPIPEKTESLPCPACGAWTQPTCAGGIPLGECPGCHGLWVPGDHFDALVTRAAEKRRQALESGGAPAPRVEGSNPFQQKIHYRKCPVCEQFMQRRNFRKASGVIIDRCNQHGTWLDADELEQITGFILAGGRPARAAFLAEQEARDEREAREARRFNAALSTSRTTLTTITTGRAEGGFSLLGLLNELLD